LTYLSGGTPVISGIVENNLVIKNITSGTGIAITELNGNIIISSSVSANSISAITNAVSVGTGFSLISAVTSSTIYLNSIVGSGGTTVSLVNGTLIISSNTSGTSVTPPINIGGGSEIYTNPGSQYQFRTLFGGGDITVTQDTNSIRITSSTITGNTSIGSGISFLSSSTSNKNIVSKTITGTGIATVSELNGLITVNVPSSFTATTVVSGTNVG